MPPVTIPFGCAAHECDFPRLPKWISWELIFLSLPHTTPVVLLWQVIACLVISMSLEPFRILTSGKFQNTGPTLLVHESVLCASKKGKAWSSRFSYVNVGTCSSLYR